MSTEQPVPEAAAPARRIGAAFVFCVGSCHNLSNMAAEFSDPAWWPKPPPKPPKPISMTKVVFGTLVPIVAVAALAVWIFTQHGAKSTAQGKSIAAFEACLRAHGATPGRAGGTATQQAVQACAGSLPTGTQLSAFGLGFGRPRNRQQGTAQAFAECMQSATAGLAGGGRLGSASARDAVRNAEELCHTLVPGSGGTPTTTQVTPTVTAPPAT